MRFTQILTYGLLNACILALGTWLSNGLHVTLCLYGWFVCSALLHLNLFEGIIATLLLGFYLDADLYGVPFGLSAYLMCMAFIILQQSGLRPTVLNCFMSFTLGLNLLLQILFVLIVTLFRGIPGHYFFSIWPQCLISMIFLGLGLPFLTRLQRYCLED